MVTPRVDGARLKQALDEFGSLQKAIDTLNIQKKTLGAEVSALTKDKTNRLGEINHLHNTIDELKQNLADLKEAFQKYKQDVDDYRNSVKQFMHQYLIFESFITMLKTSPSEKESIRELASNILVVGEAVWKFYDHPDRLRYLFVSTVLGDHLKCYRCDKCGLKIIANKEVKRPIFSPECPVCGPLSSLKADDSFLEAMLGSSNKSTDGSET